MESTSIPGDISHGGGESNGRVASFFKEAKQLVQDTARPIGLIIALAAVTAAAAIETDHSAPVPIDPVSPPAKAGKPHYAPMTELTERPTVRAVKQAADNEVDAFNHSLDIMPPSPSARQNYDANMEGAGPLIPKAPLTEVIHIRDRNIFAKEHAKDPELYPFTIYNATEHPVDILFMDYALRATRHWLNQMSQKPEGFDIGGHTLARVRPRVAPHSFTMLDRIPAFDASEHGVWENTNGLTFWNPGNNTHSFIGAYGHAGVHRNPFGHDAIATEICQSLVDVYDERTVPGASLEEHVLMRFVAGFNSPARHNLDLASQEDVCNGLGTTETAVYSGGQKAAAELPEYPIGRRGLLMGTVWYNPALYAGDVPHMAWLRNHIPHQWNELIVAKGIDTPTADYYDQHHHF